MTRPLAVVNAADAHAVTEALRAALSGDGPAMMAHAASPTALPAAVAKRVAVVVETSGSTGRPKRVELSADALLASAAAAESALGGPGQWLLALPLSYIAGLNVLTRSFAAGTDVQVMNGFDTGFETGHFITAAGVMRHPVRYTALVPVQLARLLGDDAAIDVLRRFDRILVGGQAAPADLLARALELGLNVTRTYGSSETSGGCVYDGIPVGDSVVEIVDGRVELAGSTLAEGYLDDPLRTAAAFSERGGRRWYRTDDTGELRDGILHITGRADDVIVSGGVKVSLAEVELAVRALPGLHDAVVVPAPSAEWGQVPVVIATAEVALAHLRKAITESLGRAAAPARVIVVDAIPLLPSGKPDRVRLATSALR
ncbi:MAG: AMP-binding protein [Rhodoglobus sp.]